MKRVARITNPFGCRFITPLALGTIRNPINSTMISTALFPIAVNLHIGVAKTGWLSAGLYLTSAVAPLTMGRTVDIFSSQRANQIGAKPPCSSSPPCSTARFHEQLGAAPHASSAIITSPTIRKISCLSPNSIPSLLSS